MSISASNYVPVLGTKTVTIADGGTVSTAINTKGATPLAMFLPAGWTTADITFLASYDGTTFLTNALNDGANGVYKIAAAVANTPYALLPSVFAGLQAIKIVSSVAQSGGDNIIISFGPVISQQNIG